MEGVGRFLLFFDSKSGARYGLYLRESLQDLMNLVFPRSIWRAAEPVDFDHHDEQMGGFCVGCGALAVMWI
jgi:hypothetical protein